MKHSGKIKRVLLVTPFCPPSVGGAETHLQDLYDYLRTHNYYVYVLTYQPITLNVRGKPLEKQKNLEIHRYSWIGHNLFLFFEKFPPIFNFIYLTPYLLVRSIIFMIENHQDVDIIHAHGLNASFVAAVLKKIFRKKALMSTMALYNFKPGALFSRISAGILSSLDKILAETVESKNELMSIGVPFVKIDVFSHWVNQDKFKPENKEIAKKRFGWEKKFIALFVGRAIPIKGGDTLTKVVEKIDCGINIAVISDAGPLLPTFRETAKKFKNFLFVGGVNYKDLHKYYKAADIFIIPSRYEEGAARVMMEAVCCGLPVIASNRGAIPSVLDSSVAVFVEPNEDEIGKAVNYLYSHPEKVKKLSKNCFSYGRKHFGFNNTKVVTANY